LFDDNVPSVDFEPTCTIAREGVGYQESFKFDGLPDWFVEENDHLIQGGNAYACIQRGYVKNGRIVVPDKGSISLSPSYADNHLKTLQLSNNKMTMGLKRILAIRITDVEGNELEETREAIQGAIFGTGPNADKILGNASVASRAIPCRFAQSTELDTCKRPQYYQWYL
jgi:hypothetical protein